MQKLHLVGFTTDHRALILSARRGARSGGFLLEIDEAIAAAVAEAVERAAAEAADQPEEVSPQPTPRPQSALPVRELQARLRAGRSIEEVAADAGVEPAWVARFAAPVLAEQARVVAAAREATLSRTRLGPSALPLGAAVRRNLADRGLVLTADELDGAWSSYQVEDGRWVVTLRYTHRGRPHRPSWDFDLRRGNLAARDRLAGEVGFVAGEPASPAPAQRGRSVATAAKKAPTAAIPVAPSPPESTVGRRAAAARKAAVAQLDEAAKRASRQNADVARRGARARPASDEAPTPAPADGADTAGPAPSKAKAATPSKAKAATPKPSKPRKKAASKAKATPKPKPQPKPRPAAAAAPARPTTARPAVAEPSPAPTPGGSPAARAPAPGDSIAAALAAVRRELEEELQAFEQRRGAAGPRSDPSEAFDPEPTPPARPVMPARPDEGSTSPRRREPKVVRTPIDLDELGARGTPVFRGDVAPAGAAAGNGSTPHPPVDEREEPPAGAAHEPSTSPPTSRPTRPPRTRPLRAR